MMALEHDMIGIAMTNASALVAPTFSTQRMLGTNPIAVAIPAGKEQPFVADFATTTAANGKLEILQRKNQPTPMGWVQTKAGQPSTNANELKEGGALLPLGGDREHGSHKGYMLGYFFRNTKWSQLWAMGPAIPILPANARKYAR
jgi:LDH2 family malate/lactate/ureidoglycolate dehydrogenase